MRFAGMLLENDLSTLTPLLTDPDRTQLTGRIDQATAVILQAAAEMSATTSEVIAGSSTPGDAKTGHETRGEATLQAPTAGSSVASPVPANWQQPMVPMQPPLSPPHTGELHQMPFADTCNLLQQLPADISSWNSQEALICEQCPRIVPHSLKCYCPRPALSFRCFVFLTVLSYALAPEQSLIHSLCAKGSRGHFHSLTFTSPLSANCAWTAICYNT